MVYLAEEFNLFNERIKKLEDVNRQMCLSFNTQRAKMKDLYVQTERERDELKTQLVVLEMKTQEEVTSLHQIVQGLTNLLYIYIVKYYKVIICADKIDETEVFKSELEHLKSEYLKLRQENEELKEAAGHQPNRHSPELSSLGPQMLSQVKKTLTRKLVGDSTQTNIINSPPAHSPSATFGQSPPVFSNLISDITEDHKIKGEQNATYVKKLLFLFNNLILLL